MQRLFSHQRHFVLSLLRRPLCTTTTRIVQFSPSARLNSTKQGNNNTTMSPGASQSNNAQFPNAKSDLEWRAILSPAQFRVLRQKGTEPPGTGQYNNFYPPDSSSSDPTSNNPSVFACAACDQPLYKASTKFDAGCGWPSFYAALPGALVLRDDSSHGMTRTEMLCSGCGGHLGHVFRGEGHRMRNGEKTPTDERHCVNSVAIRFKEGGEGQ